ncbi:MAG: 2-phosphosulfolactate phosphatase [Bacteroidales bacterium]|jgi:2-phosphosulfolactate phosphatase|nr:2-phosphosulfolactate phosphatase [Bacteroidales bacterium]
MIKHKITTIFTPALYPYYKREESHITVIVDILRATTTICTAIEYGATLIPVETVKQAYEYKKKGYLVAGERIEEDFSFADFGNSALQFMTSEIKGKEIVHSTTNGTKAIKKAKEFNSKEIVIGAFSNLDALKDYLIKQDVDVEVFCSGWKNTFCLEDTIFAGSLARRIVDQGNFEVKDDATFAAMELWQQSKDNLLSYLDKASHIHRLTKIHLENVFPYTFTLNTCSCVPILKDGKIIKA